jgi:ubiquinone/menaquinone biosynthesis C-methylase UbiE
MVDVIQQQGEVQQRYRNLAREYGERANRTCERIYQQIVQHFLHGSGRVLELGAGCTNMLAVVESPYGVASDLSEEMLQMRTHDGEIHCVVTAGELIPLRDGTFDGLFHVNVLEHVTNVDLVLDESCRFMRPGGT